MFRSIPSLSAASLTPAALIFSAPPAEGPEREQAPIGVLQSNASPADKASACRELKLIGGKRSVPALAALLSDEKLSAHARGALESMPCPEAAQALREAAGKTRGAIKSGIIDSIGERRDAEAVPLLAASLRDADAQVVASAALALGKIGTAETARLLSAAYADSSKSRRTEIGDGLIRCGDGLLRSGKADEAAAIYLDLAKPGHPATVRASALRGVLQSAPAKKPNLVREFLRSDDPLVRAAGAHALPELSTSEFEAVASEMEDLPADLPADSRAALLMAIRNRRGPSSSPGAPKAN